MALEYPPFERDGQPSDALVFHCADPDFQKTFGLIIRSMGFKKYDLCSRAGPEKALAEDKDAQDEVLLLEGIHKFPLLVLLGHEDCKKIKAKNVEEHFQYADAARKWAEESMPEVEFRYHLVGFQGEISR